MNDRRPVPRRLWLAVLLFSVATLLSARLGILLSVPQSTYVSFWLPAGIYLGTLLLYDTRDWKWFVLAAIPTNLLFDFLSGTPVGATFGFAGADTLEALVGAWLVRRFVAVRPELATVREFLKLLAYGALLSPMVGAFCGAATLVYSGMSHSFWDGWLTWWSNSAMAILLVTPLMLAWLPRSGSRESFFTSRAKFLEAALIALALTVFCWFMLVADLGIYAPYKPLLMLLLLWAGLRFGLRGATLANFSAALLVAFFTAHYQRGFAPEDAATGAYLLSLRSFLMLSVIIVLIPTIAVAEGDAKVLALAESEERFRNLTRAAFECICISEHGRIIDINDQGLKMFGYTRAEIIGKPIDDLVAPGSRDMVTDAIRSGRETIYTHEALRKDGTTFHVEAQARISHLENRPVRMTALRDITERRRAGEALEKSEERFRRAFDNAPIGMSLVSPEGHWLKVNQALCLLLGYTEAELLATDFQHLTYPEDLQSDLDLVHQVLDGEIPSYQMEKRYLHKNGTLVHALLSVSLVRNNQEEPLYFISQIKDITDRKQRDDERDKLIAESQRALTDVKTLSGMLPICTGCMKIRDDKGYWNQIETFIARRSNASFSHGYCPECALKFMDDAGLQVPDDVRKRAAGDTDHIR